MLKSKSALHRISLIIVLVSMPITIHIAKVFYWTVADPSQSFHSPDLCFYFAVPFVTAAGLIWLLMQGHSQWNEHPEINRDPKIRRAFLFGKLALWASAGLYLTICFLTNQKSWDTNWIICVQAFQFITPALCLHLLELIWKWYPVARNAFKERSYIFHGVLFAGVSVLFAGISKRKTLAGKVIYGIRTCYWFFIILGVVLRLPWILLSAVSHGNSLWEAFYLLGGNLIHPKTYILLAALRIYELIICEDNP